MVYIHSSIWTKSRSVDDLRMLVLLNLYRGSDRQRPLSTSITESEFYLPPHNFRSGKEIEFVQQKYWVVNNKLFITDNRYGLDAIVAHVISILLVMPTLK